MKTILILEDDVIFSRSIGNWLKKKGMATEHAATLSAARKALSAREFDLVLADLRLPDGNSTSLLEWMNERFYATPFLIMTNYGQVENAVEAMQLGAVNYLCKPVQPDRLLEAIGKIFSRPRHDGNEFYRGESAKAREMYQLVGLVARSDISVLIRGASGTGKEHIARELHEQSHRRDKPFVPVDCGTITGDLAKSEFFGHRKGTFTGAYGDRFKWLTGARCSLTRSATFPPRHRCSCYVPCRKDATSPSAPPRNTPLTSVWWPPRTRTWRGRYPKDVSGRTCSTA